MSFTQDIGPSFDHLAEFPQSDRKRSLQGYLGNVEP